MNPNRSRLLQDLEKARDSRVLVYVTGDRQGLETKIGSDVLDFFVHHLDAIGDGPRISLFLYTRGGDTLAAWSIANLILQFCDDLEVIVPAKAHSAGTLISLAANRIVMTKQATLGPIDPSVNTPLNPGIQGAPPNMKVPVSVEDVNGFIEFVRSVSEDSDHVREAFLRLTDAVNPLVLGNAFRARSQIRMLARKLMGDKYAKSDVVEGILGFLCSESGSHDYTINRREAKDKLGLPIEKPDDALYEIIKGLYDDIAAQLEIPRPFDPNTMLGADSSVDYCFSRALIESVPGGSHVFVSEGRLLRQELQTPQGLQMAIQDERMFDAWRHEDAQE